MYDTLQNKQTNKQVNKTQNLKGNLFLAENSHAEMKYGFTAGYRKETLS